MVMYGYIWVFFGYFWVNIGIYRYVRVYMAMYGYIWLCLGICGYICQVEFKVSK